MDYRSLSPGLHRRLAYSYRIRMNNLRNLHQLDFNARMNNLNNINLHHELLRDELLRDELNSIGIRTNIEYDLYNLNLNLDITNGDLSELINDIANIIIENNNNFIQYEISSIGLESNTRERLIGNTNLGPLGLEQQFNHHENFNNLIDIEKGIISKNLVEQSKVIYFGKRDLNNNDEFCCICRDNFEYTDIIRQLICEHIFHINCIDTWFTKNKTCPECRYEI